MGPLDKWRSCLDDRMMPSGDAAALEDEVARLSDDVQRAERLHEAAIEQRSIARSDEEKRAGLAAWLKTNDELAAGRKNLSEAKRRLARTQGDTFHDDVTPTI